MRKKIRIPLETRRSYMGYFFIIPLLLGAVFAVALVGMMGCNKDKEKDKEKVSVTFDNL